MLPANAQAFTINSPGSNLNVFISEYDGYHWTPTRWMQLEANRSATVRTSYPAIALANYIGLPLTITAPAGTIIGGTSATMSLPFPAITGTSWQCTNCVDFMNAVSNAVAGDEIVLQDGTYALSNNLAYSSFTANNSAGNRGFEGVTFRSYSGNRTNCIISRSANTNGGWTMDQRGGKGYPVYFKDLTFSENCTAVTQSNLMRFYDGSVWMQNVRVTGTNLYDTDGEGVLYCQNLSNNDTQNVYYLFCQFDNQSGRLLNLSGFQTNGPTGIGSTNYGTKQIICTDVFTGGTTADYHNVIVAYPITVGIYGGNIYDTQQYISTAAYNSTVGFFFTSFPQAGTTARSKNEISGGNLFACNWTSYSGYVSPNGTNEANAQSSYLLFNSFSQANGGSGSFYVFSESNNITALHNRFLLASGAGLVLRYNGATFNWNIVTNNTGGYGIRSYSFTAGGSPSTTQPLVAFGNTFDHCGTAIYSTNNEWNSYFTNNATTKCGTSMNTSPAGAAVMSSDFNTWNQTVAAAYQVNANDITDANAALDANYFPIAGGNCDGNGATNIVDYVGDSDPYGLVLIYKPTRVSRGARERPAVYPGAVLYPDIW